MSKLRRLLAFSPSAVLLFALLCAIGLPAGAQITSIQIVIDESCNGSINGFQGPQSLPCTFATDPGPGGLTGVMTYNLLNPPGLVGGDVVLLENAAGTDLLRFNPNVNGGSVFFYSDLDGGKDQPADLGLPGSFNNNVFRTNEVSIGGGEFGLIYTPTAGQPGFVANAAVPVVYTFISDAPEPATFALVALALGGLGMWRWRKSRTAPAA